MLIRVRPHALEGILGTAAFLLLRRILASMCGTLRREQRAHSAVRVPHLRRCCCALDAVLWFERGYENRLQLGCRGVRVVLQVTFGCAAGLRPPMFSS